MFVCWASASIGLFTLPWVVFFLSTMTFNSIVLSNCAHVTIFCFSSFRPSPFHVSILWSNLLILSMKGTATSCVEKCTEISECFLVRKWACKQFFVFSFRFSSALPIVTSHPVNYYASRSCFWRVTKSMAPLSLFRKEFNETSSPVNSIFLLTFFLFPRQTLTKHHLSLVSLSLDPLDDILSSETKREY